MLRIASTAAFVALVCITASAEEISSIEAAILGQWEPRGDLDRYYVGVLSSDEIDTIDPGGAWQVEDLEVELDGLTITFVSGEFFPRAAVDGQVFGAVFMGEGRWQFTPPEGQEQGELARLTAQPTIDATFKNALLRFSPDYLERFQSGALPASGEEKPAKKAREYWKSHTREQDRVLGDHDLLVARYHVEGMQHLDSLRIETTLEGVRAVKDESTVQGSPRHVYVWDPEDAEEVSLLRYHVNPLDERVRYGERLCHFPRVEHRESLTRRELSYKDPTLLDIQHVEASFAVGEGQESGESELFGDVTISFIPLFRDVNVVALSLIGGEEEPDSFYDRRVRINGVGDAEDKPLPYVHSQGEIVVELSEPARVGEVSSVRIVYQGYIGSGGDYTLMNTYAWYPRNPQQTFDRFTWHWQFKASRRWELVASGSMEKEADGKEILYDVTGSVPSCWASAILGPYMMVEDDEDDEDDERRPRVRVFSTATNTDSGREILEEAHTIIEFYEQLYGVPFPFEELDITQMSYGAGFAQALPGLIQMDGLAFLSKTRLVEMGINDPVIREMFLPHEIAHQWFAYVVGTRTDHDYWMMETFCEFSAALFREARHGPPGYDRYLKRWLHERDGANTKRTSSLWLAATGRDPKRYLSTAYARGPLLMHNLRLKLGIEKVLSIMRAILQEYGGSTFSTEDFQMVLEQATGQSFQPFFDSFVYGNEPMIKTPEDKGGTGGDGP